MRKLSLIRMKGIDKMLVGTLQIKLHAPYVHSLKEKRMIVKSIMGKVKNKFNVAVSEIAEQDIHQIIVIGIACIADHTGNCDSILDHVISFIEENSEAQMLEVIRDIMSTEE